MQLFWKACPVIRWEDRRESPISITVFSWIRSDHYRSCTVDCVHESLVEADL